MELEKKEFLISEVEPKETMTTANKMKFIVPSLLGLFLFLIPINYGGKWTIGVGILAESAQGLTADYLPGFMVGVLVLSVLLTLVARFAEPRWVMKSDFLKGLFHVSGFWLVMRIAGASFAVMVILKVGPTFIWNDFTGGTVLYELVPVLTMWFLFAGLLMPLLLEFGLMEFIGTSLRNIMRPLFRLPGRSSIDAVASWMGSGTVGVLITTKQYEEGYYTKREAAVIATNFSVASIAFSLVVISFIGLDHMFVQFYVTVMVAGLIAAIICPRIPPLSRKQDTYYEEVGKQISEDVPKGKTSRQWALERAVAKASQVKGVSGVARKGFQNVLDIWFGLIPLVMALGTVALVIVEYTSIFVYMSYPFVPILELMRIPEAQAAAPALLVGFADMFLPAVVGSGIESELTRFVIAAVSLTQLVYMSEIGILLLRSKIPLSFLDLVIVFFQRTIITLPIIVLMAHFLFF
ncbi:YjiH family protein [Alkalihalophilus lindianensis]|uniref:YjiH family protein n=1 Tax=Alkalihalophilus lindianensis TaxID=1630542 RepID=A0ABU3XCZ2_9BACI|nr:YjiH family protein [Alkalihalophilus lindianensis]MDV2685756.1 YjiH family protein [Alkalihalophilus lindianensis]